jgi:hypothetical protein
VVIILFAARAPHPLAEELILRGCTVHEALAISEVLALAQAYPAAQIVITADVGPERATVIQQHYPTIMLKDGAAVQDVLFAGHRDIPIQ